MPAVFNVNSTADFLVPPPGLPPGVVTLRSAIEEANATAGNNTINLTIPANLAGTQITAAGQADNDQIKGTLLAGCSRIEVAQHVRQFPAGP